MSLILNQTATSSHQASLDNVLPFALDKLRQRQHVCLVTIVNIEGVSPRPLGSQLVVAEDGEAFGLLTGGCAEEAIQQEALRALQRNESQLLRIGTDSPWIDIRLPCGAGMDLHFSILDSDEILVTTCDLIGMREQVSVQLDVSSDNWTVVETAPPTTSLENGKFIRNYQPSTRLIVLGTGPYVPTLSQLALAAGIEPTVWSPFEKTRNSLPVSIKSHPLQRSISLNGEPFDQWTAAVLLFHEHEWEPTLLKSLLESDCFYIGALGSRKTHADRVESLKQLGVSDAQIKRVHGPVGLPILARSPQEIAISILAEIIKTKNQRLRDD